MDRRFLWLAVLLLVLLPATARAHAELREAYPEPGATLRWERPAEVRLRFTQAVEGAHITVTNRQFATVAEGEAILSADDARLVRLPLPTLRPATYTVSWQTHSVDGHPLEGAYDFTLLPREPIITLVVAGTVLLLFGAFIFTRRAGPEERDGG